MRFVYRLYVVGGGIGVSHFVTLAVSVPMGIRQKSATHSGKDTVKVRTRGYVHTLVSCPSSTEDMEHGTREEMETP